MSPFGGEPVRGSMKEEERRLLFDKLKKAGGCLPWWQWR